MASSANQRNVCNRPAVLIGVVLILMFVCAVLMKISSERAKEGAELESLLADSRQTIDRLLREQDLTKLAKDESETELNKLKSAKSGTCNIVLSFSDISTLYTAMQDDKNKLTEDLNKQRTELDRCNTGLCIFVEYLCHFDSHVHHGYYVFKQLFIIPAMHPKEKYIMFPIYIILWSNVM